MGVKEIPQSLIRSCLVGLFGDNCALWVMAGSCVLPVRLLSQICLETLQQQPQPDLKINPAQQGSAQLISFYPSQVCLCQSTNDFDMLGGVTPKPVVSQLPVVFRSSHTESCS